MGLSSVRTSLELQVSPLPLRLRSGSGRNDDPQTLSAQRLSGVVKSGLWKRAKNGGAVFRLSHNPGCDCGHILSVHDKDGSVPAWWWGDALADLSGFGVEPHEQLVGQGDADDFRGFAGVGEALAEGDEVGFVAAHHAGHDETGFRARGARPPRTVRLPRCFAAVAPEARGRPAWRWFYWRGFRFPAFRP